MTLREHKFKMKRMKRTFLLLKLKILLLLKSAQSKKRKWRSKSISKVSLKRIWIKEKRLGIQTSFKVKKLSCSREFILMTRESSTVTIARKWWLLIRKTREDFLFKGKAALKTWENTVLWGTACGAHLTTVLLIQRFVSQISTTSSIWATIKRTRMKIISLLMQIFKMRKVSK